MFVFIKPFLDYFNAMIYIDIGIHGYSITCEYFGMKWNVEALKLTLELFRVFYV